MSNSAFQQSEGLQSINGDLTPTQTLSTGSSGTDFAITNGGAGAHTLNLPVASGTNTGKLSNTDWTTFNNKVSGPGSAVVTAIATFANTNGKVIQETPVFIDSFGNISDIAALQMDDEGGFRPVYNGGTERGLIQSYNVGLGEFVNLIVLTNGNGSIFMNGGQAGDIASGGDLILNDTGNVFSITGATTINAIRFLASQNLGSVYVFKGTRITLLFTTALTVKHNTAGGANTAKIFLSGGVDFVTSNPSTLTLCFDGTQWQETGRSINHA